MMPDYLDLRHCDNMELMARYPDKHLDLAIVDPPFGVGNFVQTTGNKRGKKVEWNEKTPDAIYFEELRRVSKHRIIFGANYYNCFEGKYGAIIWVKNQPMPNFSKAVIASCTLHKKIELYEQTWTNFSSKDRAHIHPCEMPIDLYKWLLKNYAKEGDRVLDTHLGSASIAIAVHEMNKVEKMNLTLIGCELDEDYYNQAMKRVENACLQMSLL